MDGVMFGGRDDFEVIRVRALHAANECDGEPSGEVRVFAVSLLTAAPARVAEDVDVGRPEREALIAAVFVVADGLVVLGARFGRDDVGDAVHEVRIPRGREPDGLRKDRGLPRAGNSMESFV